MLHPSHSVQALNVIPAGQSAHTESNEIDFLAFGKSPFDEAFDLPREIFEPGLAPIWSKAQRLLHNLFLDLTFLNQLA